MYFELFIIIGFFMKLYVGNLPNSMTEEELTSEFQGYGEIQSLKIITDRETGNSRGFGFIEMSDNAGRKAIQELNETELQGRKITVNEAQDRKQNNRRSY
jgi:RNA recognition motif-containing protein